MKKVVLNLDFAVDKIKQKVMKKVSSLQGLESISFDQKDKKLTVTGDIDPMALLGKVKKLCSTDIVSVGPAKEAKKEEPKKEEPKRICMRKVVLKLDSADDKIKQKVMKKVSSLQGLESISFDQKDKKLTVTGDIDPEALVKKVKKVCSTDIVSVGPAEEPKKEEPKKICVRKVVLKLHFADDKIKEEVIQKVSSLGGLESTSVDQKEKKLTVTGDMDPVALVAKVNKLCSTYTLSVGPAKEPKKEEPKKK